MDFNALLENLQTTLGGSLPVLLGALGILILGWLIAIVVRAGVRRALSALSVNRRLTDGTEAAIDVEMGMARVAYWIVLVLALIAFLNVLDLGRVSGPLEAFAEKIFDYSPQLIAGAALALVAWVLASLLRRLVTGALARSSIDEKISGEAGLEGASKSAGATVYWLTLLVFLPAVLGALGVEGILEPVQGMIDDTLAMLPNIFAAVLIAAVGFLVAKILRGVVTNLLSALGSDSLGAKIGLREGRFASTVGVIVFAAVFVPAIVAALDALKIQAISQPASTMLGQILAAVPNVLGATLILVITFLVARLVASIVVELLDGLGANQVPEKAGLGGVIRGELKLSKLAGGLVMVFAMLFAAAEAGQLLGFAQVSKLVSNLIEFGGAVLLGVVILAVGLWIANLAHASISRLSSANASLMAGMARFAILGLVLAMGLRAMGIAEDIVNLAFGLTLGSIAVASALAFGLGGREAAGRQLEHWFSTLRGERGGEER